MLRSLYSGVSGMKGFQTQMDVIANNVSNVNTHGFKAGRVLFQDMVSQNTTSASAPGRSWRCQRQAGRTWDADRCR